MRQVPSSEVLTGSSVEVFGDRNPFLFLVGKVDKPAVRECAQHVNEYLPRGVIPLLLRDLRHS